MIMMRLLKISLISFVSAMALFTSSMALAGSPVAVVERAANRVVSQLKSNKATLRSNPGVVYSIINRVILPQVDVYAMSRSVIRRSVWKQASSSQRKRFTKQFTRLVVRTYAGGLAKYTSEQVKFYPLRGGYQGKSRVRVRSKIMRRGAPSISMNYRLIRRGGSWKVYDISVEGVSLLHSFRSQFASQLRKGDFEALIKRLTQHNQRRQ